MSTPDIVNGIFEMAGGLFILNHCRVLYNEKKVAGVSILSTAFFLSWGFWNIYYYSSLDQWWSFTGGLLIAAANVLWVSLLIYYKKFYKHDVEKHMAEKMAIEIRKEIDAEVVDRIIKASYTVTPEDIKLKGA